MSSHCWVGGGTAYCLTNDCLSDLQLFLHLFSDSGLGIGAII